LVGARRHGLPEREAGVVVVGVPGAGLLLVVLFARKLMTALVSALSEALNWSVLAFWAFCRLPAYSWPCAA
jgi:hypothetical protein